MGRSNEIRTMSRMVQLIKKKKVIHNYDLRESLNISKSLYNAIKPDLEHQFGWAVKYDKQTKCWRYVGIPDSKEIDFKNAKKREQNAL